MPQRKRTRAESSQSAEPQVDERVTPRQREDPAAQRIIHQDDVALHTWLQFEIEADRQDRSILEARAASHGYAPLRYLSWAPLRSLGLQTRVTELCGDQWTRLFGITDDVCDILTLEFLSTLHVIPSITDPHYDGAITFRLGGGERRLSLWQFAVHMGLFTEAERDSPAFTEAISDFPQGVTPQQAWRELGTGNRQPNPKSTEFSEPAFRIIHRAIVHGIAGRGDSSVGNVMHSDIFYLYCMVHQIPCQIAECLIRYLFQVRRQKHTQEVFGGGYVLRLATSMGIEAPAAIPPAPQYVATAKAIDMAVLLNMRMVMRQGSTYILRDQPGVRGREAGPSGTASDAGGSGVQVPTTTTVSTTTVPVPPPAQEAPIPPPPQGAPRRVFESGQTSRLRELETMIAAEYTHAEAYRSTIFRGMELLAASLAPHVTLPRPPVRPQYLSDFIRRHTPDATPDATSDPDPDQPPPQP